MVEPTVLVKGEEVGFPSDSAKVCSQRLFQAPGSSTFQGDPRNFSITDGLETSRHLSLPCPLILLLPQKSSRENPSLCLLLRGSWTSLLQPKIYVGFLLLLQQTITEQLKTAQTRYLTVPEVRS